MAKSEDKIPYIGTFPSDDVEDKIKNDKSYGKAYAKAMMKEFYGGDDYIKSTRRRRYVEARQYRNGTQSTARYKKQLLYDGEDGYVNINVTPVPIIPFIVDVVVNNKTSLEYDVKVNAIDPTAQSARDEERRRRLIQLAAKPAIQQVEQQTGMQLGGYNPDVSSVEEIELDLQLNFKQAVEIAAEQGINYIFDLNEYEDTRRQIVDDVCTYNKAGTRTYIDPNYGVMIRPVRVENLAHSHPKGNNFDSIKWAGEIISTTVGEAKRLANGELDEKDWKKIAQLASRNNNPEVHADNNTGILSDYDSRNYYQYDSNGISLLYFEFITTNKMVYEKKGTRYGRDTLNKRDESYKLPENSKYKRELIKRSYEVVYSGYYVVGTDYVFGYKKMNNQLRKDSDLSKTRLSFNIYNIDGQSMVERMIPYADAMTLDHLKIQHLRNKVRPQGLVVYDDLLRGIKVDGKQETSPADLLRIFNQTGIQFAKWLDESGDFVGREPFKVIDGGIPYDRFRFLLEDFRNNLDIIRQITGVNETMGASESSSEALVGVERIRLASSNNATRHIDVAWQSISKRTAQSVCLGMQDIIRYSTGLDRALGKGSSETLKIIKDIPIHEFGIIIDVEPDEVERQYLENNIATSLSAGELRLEDAMAVRSVKNTKLANQMLILRRKKYAQEKQAIDERNIQLNGQMNVQATQAKAQTEQQLKMLEAEIERMKIENQANADAMLMKMKYTYEMILEQVKGGLDVEAARMSSMTKVELDKYKEDRKDERIRMQEDLRKEREEEAMENESEENEMEVEENS